MFMNTSIYLTFDYEVFLGNKSGGIEDCLLIPTERIIKIVKSHKVPVTFYVDFGFLIQLKDENFLNQIIAQLKELIDLGSSIQLHLHPHWFSTTKTDSSKRFYIDQYSQAEIQDFIIRCFDFASDRLKLKLTSYRAGSLNSSSLCKLESTLFELGVETDSSILDSDLKKLSLLRQFKISTTFYPPVFYWKLIYERFFGKASVRRFGKGNSKPMPAFQKVKRLLFGSFDHLSFDSNKWQRLGKSQFKRNEVVILSHPKSMNMASLQAMDRFIEKHKKNMNFKSI